MGKVLVILGMHRSGTSILARYLQACGLSIGTELLGKHESNPAGHFEDKDFLALHNSILKSHRLDYRVYTEVQWNWDSKIKEQAQVLITERNRLYNQWGWKDPRTCLFLPFWKELLPECCFIVTYRCYQDVLQSLISRDIQMYRDRTSRLQRLREGRFSHEEINKLAHDYLRIWIWYNNEIIRHIFDDTSTVFLFINFSYLIHGEMRSLVDALNQMGFALSAPIKFDKTLSRSMITREFSFQIPDALIQSADEIHRRFTELQQSAARVFVSK